MAETKLSTSADLRRIEERIQLHKKNIVNSYFQIGDELNEAKERGLVPHGRWEQWVTEQAEMSVRGAQRLMQVAKEIPPEKRLGSMGRLGLKSTVALLALPEGEREAMADRAVSEGMSSREVEIAVRKAREEGKAEAAAEAAEQLKMLHEDFTNASRAKYEAETARNKLHEKYSKMMGDYHQLEAEHKAASERATELAKALERAQTLSANEITPGAQAEIDRLRTEKAQAEAAMLRAMERRQQAEQELLKVKRAANRESVPLRDEYQGLTLAAFGEACRLFIGKVGVLPQLGAQMAALSPREKLDWNANLDMIANFVEGARKALSCVKGEIIDV